TAVAGIPHAVAIGVGLLGIGQAAADVARVARAVAVEIALVGIDRSRAVVVAAGRLTPRAGVDRRVAVGYAVVVGVGVARVPVAVPVGVELIGVRHEVAVVAGV